MKHQVTRLSPHQNAKVLAVLMAVTSLIVVIPMWIFSMSVGGRYGAAMGLTVFIIPVGYLIGGYIMSVIASLIYNFIAQYTGGMEFETEEAESD